MSKLYLHHVLIAVDDLEKGKRRTGRLLAGAIATGLIKTDPMKNSRGFSCLRTAAEGELCRKVMNIYCWLCLLSVVLVAGCTDLPRTTTVAANAVPTPTPENYGLYTDQDLQVYADTLDLKIQLALKNNDANQAQELGRKRQELIAEFNRRHLKRTTVVPSHHPYRQKPASPPQPHILKQSGNGLPGEN